MVTVTSKFYHPQSRPSLRTLTSVQTTTSEACEFNLNTDVCEVHDADSLMTALMIYYFRTATINSMPSRHATPRSLMPGGVPGFSNDLVPRDKDLMLPTLPTSATRSISAVPSLLEQPVHASREGIFEGPYASTGI